MLTASAFSKLRAPRSVGVSLLIASGGCNAAHLGGAMPGFPGWVAVTALIIFVVAMGLAVGEELLNLRKSKPVLLAAGLIWALIAWANHRYQLGVDAEKAARHSFVQYLELMLFLLVVMAYVNALNERRVFAALRTWLGRRDYSWRSLFWLTGGLTFVLSPVLDNLSTALVIGSAIITLGRSNPHFTVLGCINVVVAANAGGSFSAVGDLTTCSCGSKKSSRPRDRSSSGPFF